MLRALPHRSGGHLDGMWLMLGSTRKPANVLREIEPLLLKRNLTAAWASVLFPAMGSTQQISRKVLQSLDPNAMRKPRQGLLFVEPLRFGH
jgi:hypothetical protein